jgi:hypothetical protein
MIGREQGIDVIDLRFNGSDFCSQSARLRPKIAFGFHSLLFLAKNRFFRVKTAFFAPLL